MNPQNKPIYEIIEELNLENGSNYKKAVLAKYKDNKLLQRVLKMTEDKVSYTFGITMKNIVYNWDENDSSVTRDYGLSEVLDIMEEEFCTREVTGNKANERLILLLRRMRNKDDAYVIERILGRDLKIRLGRTEINKVFKNLIVKPAYTRCEIGTKANITKNMPMDKDGNFIDIVYSQEKMDGTFRRAIASDGVEITSRPGIVTEFPLIEKQVQSMNIDGNVLIGEMTLRGEKDRKKGNGLINSDNIPHDDIVFTVWDMIPIEEFRMTKDEIKKAEKAGTMSLYVDRLCKLKTAIASTKLDNIELIKYKVVKNMKEAYEHFQEITRNGGEGTVIKGYNMTHKDGNSKLQLKVKLIIELDMRFTSYNEGNKGSKNEAYFSGINFQNDEGTIKGTVGVTSMTEDERDWFHENRDLVIGNVAQIVCNDLTQARGNDYHALSHPRYEMLRGPEKVTDTLERAQEQKQMAMELK